MPSEPNPNDLRSLWQNREVEPMTITVEEIRRRASRFERRIQWRNIREYAAGALVLAFLARRLSLDHGLRVVPGWLIAAGTIYVMIQIHLRGAARATPQDAGIWASLEFHRLELERQRDALRSVWRWYLLPFVPGFAASLIVAGVDKGFGMRLGVFGIMMVLLLVAVWRLNVWAARRLDRQIEEIKQMETKNE
jgi:hypothetical protein